MAGWGFGGDADVPEVVDALLLMLAMLEAGRREAASDKAGVGDGEPDAPRVLT